MFHKSTHQRIVDTCVGLHFVNSLSLCTCQFLTPKMPSPLNVLSPCDSMTNSINAQLNVRSSKNTWRKGSKMLICWFPHQIKNQMKMFAPLHMIKHPYHWRAIGERSWMCYIAEAPILKENRNAVKIEMGRVDCNLRRVNYCIWRTIKAEVSWREKSQNCSNSALVGVLASYSVQQLHGTKS